MRTVSVVGLGKVGSSMVGGLSSRGVRVIGTDVLEDNVKAINDGRSVVWEPGLDDLLRLNRDMITGTSDVERVVMESEATFIIVPTPSETSGHLSLTFIKEAAAQLGKALRNKDGYHLFVVTSTVLPGDSTRGIIPVLESESEKKCGVDFGYCYSPAFIALGNVVDGFLAPDFFLVGESDSQAGGALEEIYLTIRKNEAPVKRMAIWNAELTKIAINGFVTAKISFANMLGEICQHMEQGDADAVTDAVGSDSRIGRRFFSAGGAFGGPCFPRDNRALSAVLSDFDIEFSLPNSVDDVNNKITGRLIDKIRDRLRPGTKVAVIGLAYKEGSISAEESQGVRLISELLREGCEVVGYDPLASDSAEYFLNGQCTVFDVFGDWMKTVDVFVLTGQAEAFLTALEEFGPEEGRNLSILDVWRQVDPARVSNSGASLIHFGRNPL